MNSLKLGLFLAIRQVKNGSKIVSGAIIFVMVLVFLNLVVVSGILVGLIQGSEVAFKEKYLGDVIVGPLDKKSYVENSGQIINYLKNDPSIKVVDPRYTTRGEIEANYRTKKSDDTANKKGVAIIGFSPREEALATGLDKALLEGEYLTDEDASKSILVGKDLLAKYSIVADADPTILRDVSPGTKVRITISGNTNEYTVKGIVKVKAGELSQSVFMHESEVRKLTGRSISQIDNINVRINSNTTAQAVKQNLTNAGFDNYAKIETFEEGAPAFVKNMKSLFGLLGNFFGAVGIVVAIITLSIVIFINALNRRRQIGIMKGIGIAEWSIEFSYILQSIFYALIGSTIGLIITYSIMVPAFEKHPIDFPFSDGILVADIGSTAIKLGILVFFSILAGYLPARMIVKKNTLNAILGR
jgi:putative ABC transport system permease protein